MSGSCSLLNNHVGYSELLSGVFVIYQFDLIPIYTYIYIYIYIQFLWIFISFIRDYDGRDHVIGSLEYIYIYICMSVHK